MIYQWKQGAHVKGVKAQVAGEVLEALREQTGNILPADVVDVSRPDDAPLHPVFEWDDHVAAESYRTDQARSLLRSVVVQRDDEEDTTPIQAFVVVRQDDDDVYQSTYVAMADTEMREQVLARALKELQAWQRKYRELKELATVFAAADGVLATAG